MSSVATRELMRWAVSVMQGVDLDTPNIRKKRVEEEYLAISCSVTSEFSCLLMFALLIL